MCAYLDYAARTGHRTECLEEPPKINVRPPSGSKKNCYKDDSFIAWLPQTMIEHHNPFFGLVLSHYFHLYEPIKVTKRQVLEDV